jgi:O-antigen ligase
MEFLINNRASVFYSLLFVFSIVVAVALYQPVYLLIPFLGIVVHKILELSIKNTALVFLVIAISLPLSIEWQVTPSLSLDFPTEPLLILLSFLAICKWLYNPNIFPKVLLKSSLFFIILLHLMWLFLVIFFSSHEVLSLKFFIAKIWYVVPMVMMLQHVVTTYSQVQKAMQLIILSMLFVIAQSIVRHSFEGFSFEGIKYTLSPFFRNHVNYSATLVLLFPFLVYLKPFDKKYVKSVKNNCQIFIVTFFIIAIFLAYSRGAWLAIVIGSFVGVLITYNKLKHFLLWIFIGFVCMITYLLANNTFLKFAPQFNTTIYHSNLSEHLQATIALKDVSNAERFYRWVAGFNMVKEHPITGFGTNTFYYHYKHYTAQLFKTWVSENKDHSTVHNYFLLTIVEQGLIGFILFASMVLFALLKAQKLYNAASNNNYKQLAKAIGVMLSMLVVLNFLSDLIETDKVGLFFWVSLGLLIWLEQRIKSVDLRQ